MKIDKVVMNDSISDLTEKLNATIDVVNTGVLPDGSGSNSNDHVYVKDFEGATDAQMIQSAIDYAFENEKSVVVPEPREYNLTSGIRIRDNIELRGERLTNYVVNGNFRVFEIEKEASIRFGTITVHSTNFSSEVIYLDGKHRYGAANQKTFVKDLDIVNFSEVVGGTAISLFASGDKHYIHYVNFENISIYHFKVGVLLKCVDAKSSDGGSWINANRFDKVTISECEDNIILDSHITYPNDCSGNSFTNLQIQPSVTTKKVLTITGEGNLFSGVLWDTHLIQHSDPVVEFKEQSMFNDIDFRFLDAARVVNYGWDSNTTSTSVANRERVKWNKGFLARDIEVRNTNWDIYTDQGVNQVSQHTPFLEELNQPIGAHTYGSLIVFNNNGSITQMYIPSLENWLSGDQKMTYIRTFGGSWNDWVTFGLSDNDRKSWNNGFLARDIEVRDTDWDIYTSQGVNEISQNTPFLDTLNQPVDAYTYGNLLVFSNGTSTTQMYVPTLENWMGRNEKRLYIRTRFGEGWNNWVTFGATDQDRAIWDSGMLDRYTVEAETDWNSIIQMGTYRIFYPEGFSGVLNHPVDSQPYGNLLVFKSLDSISHMYMSDSDGEPVKYRTSYNSGTSWSEWYTMGAPIIPSLSSDPVAPKIGQMWLRSDL